MITPLSFVGLVALSLAFFAAWLLVSKRRHEQALEEEHARRELEVRRQAHREAWVRARRDEQLTALRDYVRHHPERYAELKARSDELSRGSR